MKEPSYKKLTAMHMFAWKKGLKTGIYYFAQKQKLLLSNLQLNLIRRHQM